MKRSLLRSLSWSFVVLSSVAFGAASCTVEERNFNNSGGSAGAGGSGMVCKPDSTAECYSGPPETLEVGLCKAGQHVCLPSGNGFSECGGEVLPTKENCLTPEDEACNGELSDDCPTLSDGWLETFGTLGFGQTIQDVAITNKGEIVAVGYFADTIDVGLGPIASTGSTDILVAKFDPFGKAIWAKRFGDASAQAANGVAVDSGGAIYVGGSMAGSVDFEGTLLTSAGGNDGFIARFEPDGTVGWAHSYGDTASQVVRRVAVSKTNLVIVAGEFAGTITFDAMVANKHVSAGLTDVFLARFDTSGFLSSSRAFGGMGVETIRGMALDSADRVYVTGGYEATADFAIQQLTSTGVRDAYVALFLPNLNPLQVMGFGNPNGPMSYQEGYDIAVGPNDEVFMSGGFSEGLDFPGQFLSNPDSTARSMFLAQFAPQLGAPSTAVQFGGLGGGSVAEARLAVDPTAKQLVIAGGFVGDMDFGGGNLHADGALDPYFAKLGFDQKFVAARSLPNDPSAIDGANIFVGLALLPSGDLIVGGVEHAPIMFGAMSIGEQDSKDGDAVLGRFIH